MLEAEEIEDWRRFDLRSLMMIKVANEYKNGIKIKGYEEGAVDNSRVSYLSHLINGLERDIIQINDFIKELTDVELFCILTAGGHDGRGQE